MPKMSYDFVEIKKIEEIPKDSVIGEIFITYFYIHQYTINVCYRCDWYCE